MTIGALVVGVGAVAFSLTLTSALRQVGEDLNRDLAAPIRVELFGQGDPAAVAAAIRAQPGTARLTGIAPGRHRRAGPRPARPVRRRTTVIRASPAMR